MGSGLWKRLRHLSLLLVVSGLVAAAAFASPVPLTNAAQSSDKKDQPAPKTKIRIRVTDANGKPVGQASVYVRFNESGGLFHKDKLAELDLKTNDDGTARVPAIPQGKIMIQVIAKGWRTYGRWYDIQKEEETVDIKLQAPPHWY
jgi:hypothetical protein